MKIVRAHSNFEREPLLAPFGFKGAYLSEIWQSAVAFHDVHGEQGIGLDIQSVLWSDASVFTSNTQSAGNSMMFLVTAYAANKATEYEWETPIELLDKLLPETYNYAKKITSNPHLRLTFALNALVSVDNAAWQLYARSKKIKDFDTMVPERYRKALSNKQEKLAGIPLMSYGVPIEKIIETIKEGCFFLKIKIGSDPEKDGDLEKMLKWDMNRLTEIHEAVKNIKTPHTDSGHIPYYLDANGRYTDKKLLMRFINHAENIGALERIMIMEEPFPEEYKADVSDIPVRLAADESAHSDEDVIERIKLGYKAIALKPIAKTMSMSLKIAQIAHEHDIPCFCADLTVNPVLVDWNKNVAARLAIMPGMKVGLLESNGHQNYKNWQTMKSYHPLGDRPWMNTKNGLYVLDKDFYETSGGIFEISRHYSDLASGQI